MMFNDYLYLFDHTCISIDFPDKYVKKSLIYDGNHTLKENEQVKFYFALDENKKSKTDTPENGHSLRRQ